MDYEFLLEKVMRRLLGEELVSLKRYKTPEQTYSVEFDDAGNVISGAPARTDAPAKDPSVDTFLKYRQLKAAYPRTFKSFFGEMPQSDLINFLNTTTKFLQDVPPTPGRMAELFDAEEWRAALRWPVPNRVGRGEQQLRIAFRASDTKGKIDFPFEGGGGLSVKYVGNGGDEVQSGEKCEGVRAAIEAFKEALLNDRKAKLVFINTDVLKREIDESVRSMAVPSEEGARKIIDQRAISNFFSRLRSALAALRIAVVTEHGANGTIFISTEMGSYVPARRAARVRIKRITSEARVSFLGPESLGGGAVETFEKAIEKKHAEWTRPGV